MLFVTLSWLEVEVFSELYFKGFFAATDSRGVKVEAGIPMRKLVYLIQITGDGGLIRGGSGERSQKWSDLDIFWC